MHKFSNINNNLLHSLVGFEFEFYSNVSYYKTLELLNNVLNPIKVLGFKQYHSKFKPDSMNFKIEPDHSGGSNMVELVTGPLEYTNAKMIMLKILKFIQEYGRTTEKCSVHMNISFNEDKTKKNLNNLNMLKMILNFDEDSVYRKFPERQNNIYAKSIKSLIPFKNYTHVTSAVSIVQNNFHLPDKKYYGINFSHISNTDGGKRLEFRYCGASNYENKTADLLELLDYFIEETWNNCGIELDNGDIDKLHTYMTKNIATYNNFSTLQQFMADHPSVDFRVNSNNSYDYVNSYFSKIKDKLFELFSAVEKLENCVINYAVSTNDIEIIDTNIKTLLDMKGFVFIDCTINSSMFNKCVFANCEIEDSHLTNCDILGSNVDKGKLLNCKVNSDSILTDCYYNGGLMEGRMEGGVFRAGRLGENGELSSTTRIIRNTGEDFFGIKKVNIDKKKDM